jgi:hypothetical protein
MHKKSLLSLGLLLISSTLCKAATYTITGSNFTGGSSDTAITDNAGNVLTNATNIAAIGYFRTFTDPGSAPSTDVSMQTNFAIASDFEILASNDFDTTSVLSTPVSGFYSISTDIESAESNTLVTAGAGKTAYILFANDLNVTSATQIAVVQTANSITSDFTGGGPFQTGANFPVTVIVGNVGGSVESNFFGDFDSADSIALELVPEPSSAALLGLGGLALLMRRRRESNL